MEHLGIGSKPALGCDTLGSRVLCPPEDGGPSDQSEEQNLSEPQNPVDQPTDESAFVPMLEKCAVTLINTIC